MYIYNVYKCGFGFPLEVSLKILIKCYCGVPQYRSTAAKFPLPHFLNGECSLQVLTVNRTAILHLNLLFFKIGTKYLII